MLLRKLLERLDTIASMRPRSKDRGSQSNFTKQVDAYPCFNEAAIKGSRKSAWKGTKP